MGKEKHAQTACVGKSKLLDLVEEVSDFDGKRFESGTTHRGLVRHHRYGGKFDARKAIQREE